MTFDDAVVTTNFPFYKDELTNRKNPNGHPISATFFVAHEYTDYSFVHELWEDGHEIALHSISHDYNQDYWRSLNQTGWELEVVDQRLQMSTLAAIPESDIKGMRAPQLQMGGDEMHRALHEAKFLWENSRPTLSYRNPGMWPYSNDYKSTQDCRILPCAEGSYPGFWTIPMIDLMSNEEIECSMADACIPIPVTPEETFGMLQKNFLEQYTGNRAPFELSIHAGWVNGTGNETIAERRKGYSQFLDYLATMDDVYIVSISRALEWIKTPVRLADVKDFKPFQAYDRQGACRKTSCRYQTPFEKLVITFPTL